MLAVALDQAERIRQSVASSFAARDLYTEKQVAALVESLRESNTFLLVTTSRERAILDF